MMPRMTIPIQVRVLDLPEVQKLVEDMKRENERLRRERDEWKKRYKWLLGEAGGPFPR